MQSWKSCLLDEITLQLITTVFTNITLLPAIVRSFRIKKYFEFIIFSSVMVTSILYHWAEISGSRIFGMSSGNWHRLDNVFGILIAQSLFLYFADFHSAEVNELFRWLCLVVTLFFQLI